MPEDVCVDELEDSQCLSDDTDTEAASEVGIPWDHPTSAAAFGVGKADFSPVGFHKKKRQLSEVILIPRYGLIRFLIRF